VCLEHLSIFENAGPNITGDEEMDTNNQSGNGVVFRGTGSFRNSTKAVVNPVASYNGDVGVKKVGAMSFEANRSSSIYSGASTVQPPSIRTLLLIRF